jgi:hypothetical protein
MIGSYSSSEAVTPSQSVSQVSLRDSYIARKRKFKNVSDIWYHFEKKKSRNLVYCDYCNYEKEIQKNSGTNKYWQHLEKEHKEHYLKARPLPKAQKTLTKVKPQEAYFNQDEFDLALVHMIDKCDLSFELVGNQYFKNVLTMLKHDLEIISPDTLKRRILDLYETKKKEKMELLVRNTSKISFTTDCWTSPNKLAFMGVTPHWVNEEFEICCMILSFKPLPAKHTGENLAAKLKEILGEFGLWKKSMAVTMDNASNNDAMYNCLALDYDLCFAHVVNLGVVAALDVIKEELSLLRRIIRIIRSGPQSFLRFREINDIVKIADLKPILDVLTRWNSTYDMMDRALKLEKSIQMYVSQYDSNLTTSEMDKAFNLKGSMWGRFRDIMEYLQKFKEVSTVLCGDKYPTLSMVVPQYNRLLKHLEKYGEKTRPAALATSIDPLHRSVVAAHAKIKEYYNVTSETYTVATVLDPRLKLDFYDDQEKKAIFKTVKSFYDGYKILEDDPEGIYLN